MKPSDISSELSAPEKLHDGFTAPEVLAELARDDWEVAANDRGMLLQAYQPCKGTKNGLEVVAWCVDEEADMYLVVFDRAERRVYAVYDGKARQQNA